MCRRVTSYVSLSPHTGTSAFTSIPQLYTAFVEEESALIAEVLIDNDSLRGEWAIELFQNFEAMYSIKIWAESDVTFTTDVYDVNSAFISAYGFRVQQGPFPTG